MKDKRFLTGLLMTVGWLVFSGYMLVSTNHPQSLNEWGDSFAGFFAPLAFFWLVLGYLQQGDELRQSSKALQLQAEELKNSVEQQSQLVAISRQQLEQELLVVNEQRERQLDAMRPRILATNGGSTNNGVAVDYKLKLLNVGATATAFRFMIQPDIQSMSASALSMLNAGGSFDLSLRFRPGQAGATLHITYVDSSGAAGAASVSLAPNEGTLDIGPVERER